MIRAFVGTFVGVLLALWIWRHILQALGLVIVLLLLSRC